MKTAKGRRFAIVIAGGAGERFWPASRIRRPKHMLCLYNARSLLANTVGNIEGVIPRENILVVTHARQAPDVRGQLPGVRRENIIAEPLSRNTAPAIALGLSLIRKKDPDACVAILPADHLIRDVAVFRANLTTACRFAAGKDTLLAIGVKPVFPSTGYGYIRLRKPLKGKIFAVDSFVEKPSRIKAKGYVKSGRYLWNSGMTVFSIKAALEAYRRHIPKLYAAFDELAAAASRRDQSKLKCLYEKFPNVSIDYGIMEKSDNLACLRADFDWSDIGSWDTLGGIFKKDRDGNTRIGPGLSIDAKNVFTCSSDKRLVAALGVRDLVIVSSEDAVLVCRKDAAQDVKKLVNILAGDKNLRRLC